MLIVAGVTYCPDLSVGKGSIFFGIACSPVWGGVSGKYAP